MSKSNISDIVTKHGLKLGDKMRNIHGEEIENSAVLSNHGVIIRRDNDIASGYDLILESPIHGTQASHWLSAKTVETLKAITF